jgi:molecular chaperone GrpE
MMSPEEEVTGPVIRDRRRIDPVTGQIRDPETGQVRDPGPPSGKHAAQPVPSGDAGNGSTGQGNSGQGDGGTGNDGASAAAEAAALALAERTSDLQRLQAEYANYRKRVERDRVAVREQALASVLGELLPVLDDVGRAREHGELTGGFKSVAESLEAATAKLGLTRYGEDGEPFDPNVHEALMHSYSPDVTEPTCVRILQPGYRIGERTLRPARVAVAEPGEAEGDGSGADSPADGPEPADTN